MKLFLAPAFALLGLPVLGQGTATTPETTTAAPATTAPAPGAPPPNGGAMMDQVTSVLSPAEKDQLMNVRMKAMTQNPDLQTEEMGLMQKGMSLQGGAATDADKQAFRAQVKEHADKVRAAMVKVDPTIEPVLQKIEAQIAKMRAQYQSQ